MFEKFRLFMNEHPLRWLGWYFVAAFTLILGLFIVQADARAEPTVTLTASPTQAISPASITLTWSSTESSGCTASGGWSGTKAASGTETLTNVRASATYTLVCSSATGSATVSWTPPTTNTDGSTIPATGPGSLAGFEVFHALTAAQVAGSTPINVPNKTATSLVIPNLPVGAHYYAAKAYNVDGIRSDLSATANNVIVLPSGTASASVVVNVKPMPPVVTVATTANLWRGNVSYRVGRVEIGTGCEDLMKDGKKADWYTVPREAVSLNFWGRRLPESAVIVAKCA